MTKISIIGAGAVGSTTAFLVAQKELGDVVLIDIVEGMPQGRALDIQEAAPLLKSDSKVTGSNNYEDIKNSDIVVITAGLPRKPGMTRLDLIETNKEIVGIVAENIKQYTPNAIVIVVTNPLDLMTHVVLDKTGFDPKKVIGMAGVLDSTRFRTFIAMELKVSPKDVEALVMGNHGDNMVPLPKHTTVNGKLITELLDKEIIDKLVDRTRKGGGEIVGLSGSAYYAPASAITKMIEAILTENDKILPVSAFLQGQYGLDGIYLGVPVKLNKEGVKEIIELELSEDEMGALKKSAKVVEENLPTVSK